MESRFADAATLGLEIYNSIDPGIVAPGLAEVVLLSRSLRWI